MLDLQQAKQMVMKSFKNYHFWGSLGVCLIIFIIMISLQLDLQWFWLLLYAALIIPFSPFITDPTKYFRGGLTDTARSWKALLLLAASTSISWVFAKSILNASLLGAEFGVVGGVAYASYYTSFASVAFVVFFMRTRKGYQSLPAAINERYGSLAALAFGLAVFFRLFQEVWSNALVVAGFYGTVHSTNWWLGAILSTLIPVIYSFTGGMRASILTDMGQTIVCVGFLVALVITLGINTPVSFASWNPRGSCSLPNAGTFTYNQCAIQSGAPLVGGAPDISRTPFTYTNATCNYATIPQQSTCTSVGGVWTASKCAPTSQASCTAAGGTWHGKAMWTLPGGVDLLIVGLLQGLLSYPFFDPVLTDRAFLAEPYTMVGAFTLGGLLAALFIFLFSFAGIFGNAQASLDPFSVPASIFANFRAGYPQAVSRFFGTAVFSITNIIFITESLSTLDSTFTSAAKLFGPEFMGLLQNGVPQPPQKATQWHLWMGRLTLLLLAVVGILPLMANPTALDATTISGTIVMGLGPPVYALTFLDGYHPLTFHLPFWWGVALGIVYQLSTSACCKANINMAGFSWGGGRYATLLGVNVIGAAVAWALMLLTLLENPLAADTTERIVDGNNFWQVGRSWLENRGLLSHGRKRLEPLPSNADDHKLSGLGPTSPAILASASPADKAAVV